MNTLSKASLAAVAALALTATPSAADTLTPADAWQRAINAAATGSAPRALRARVASAPIEMPAPRIITGADNAPALYGFNLRGKGWIITPADDIAAPLLGWSTTGVIADEMPCGLEYMLESYAREISHARSMGAPAYAAEDTPDRLAIEPLIKTQWDQKTPYNDLTPVSGGDGFGGQIHCYTGCQATSMAQVMNYFRWPEIGTGEISYVSNLYPSAVYDVNFNFGATHFDWDNMLPTYTKGEYTEEQGMAVATLMAAAGASVNMLYSSTVSATYSAFVPWGMYTYLGYNSGSSCVMRDNFYPASGWDDFVYKNLSDYGPVLYSGVSATGSGHAFVCDGYSSDGFFHFNWGWSGTSDGYFRLSALNPMQQGSGGSQGSAYNYDQDIIAGLNPFRGPNKGLDPCIVGYYIDETDPASADYFNRLIITPDELRPAGKLTVEGTIANMTQTAFSFSLALRFTKEEENSTTSIYSTLAYQEIPDMKGEGFTYDYEANKLTLESMRFVDFRATGSFPHLMPGKWRVEPVFKLGTEGEWHLIRWPMRSTGIYWIWAGENGKILEFDSNEDVLSVSNFRWADDHSPADNRYYVSYTYDLTSSRGVYDGEVYGALYRSGFTSLMEQTETAVNVGEGETVPVSQNLTSNRIVNHKDYYIMLYSDPFLSKKIGGPFTFTAGEGPQNGIDDITAPGSDTTAPAWFTLQGMRVATPEPGRAYIRVDSRGAMKVAL